MTGFWKVFGAAAIVVAVAVAIVGALALRTVDATVDAHLQRRVEAETELLAAAVLPGLRSGDASGLEAQVHALAARLPKDRLTVLDATGVVLADSHADARSMENHLDREEVQAALHDPHPLPIARTSHTLHEDMVYLALAVHDGEHLLGFARVAVPAADVRAERAELSTAVLLGAGLALLAGAAAGAVLAGSVRRPLRQMTGFVDAVARGDAPPRLPARSMGDLSGLADAINTMADQLAERFERIVRDQSEIRAILGAMVEGVLAVDSARRVVLLNAAACDTLGTTEEQARGKPVWEVTRLPEITELIERCLRTARPAWIEARLIGQPHDRVLRLAASPLADARGLFGCVLVLHDLSELRRLETVRRDFVVNVSHELKTPLTSLRGYLDAVLDDAALPDELQRRFLARARDATERLVAIVADLLTLARVEAEDSLPRHEPLDLRDLAVECAAAAADAAALRGAQVQLDLPGEPVPIAGDDSTLATAINNLLDNALKYGPAGGLVRLCVRREGEEALLEVEDRGPGIPEHEHERIWERFYRVDRSRGREPGGTGLGLSIVRNVAGAHGGRVSLDSEVGRGSTFRIHLPLRPASAPAVSS
ncbi:MAG TPA: ATP-binding protein [Planctomycetota bacterium]|nr:ATP-binding protein [Planctomycetota bacterium]